MLRILVNSYTCCPGMGSEQGMGWNWITSLARYCELFVISEGEYKMQCEEASKDMPIHWYWNPVDQSTREKCWNQGNWSFYPLYKKWQRKTADIARGICHDQKIDILHQLNMIGFREPGYLADVSKETEIPLVWGPIGGLKMFPLSYASGAKQLAFNWLKNTITRWQIKHDKRVGETLRQASVLISSIPDSYQAIKKYHNLESFVIPETGCFVDEKGSDVNRFNGEALNVIWVGKFDFRKRLDIAIEAVKMANQRLNTNSRESSKSYPAIILSVYGTGTEKQVNSMKTLAEGGGYIEFKGSQPNDVVKKAMKNSDVFLFTSVSEDTTTVVLEAVSSGLPVICFDACGMANVIDDKVGIKVPLSNSQKSITDFAAVLVDLYEHRPSLRSMSNNCHDRALELSWDRKARQVIDIYKNIVEQSV